VAIDGKCLRGSGSVQDGLRALHLVQAWSIENHLCLGQVAVDQKSNEITAIPALLELLELKGALVVIGAQKGPTPGPGSASKWTPQRPRLQEAHRREQPVMAGPRH
jgi:hypothetical protein